MMFIWGCEDDVSSSSGNDGNFCRASFDCNRGLACVLEQFSDVCRTGDGTAGSACGGRLVCNSGLECLRVNDSHVCAALGESYRRERVRHR